MAKLDEGEDEGKEVITTVAKKSREFVIEATSVRSRGLSVRSLADTSASLSTRELEFDIYEREGYDKIMRTVAGNSEEEEDQYAKSICDMLEVFERMTHQA